LNWMITTGVAASITCTASFVGPGVLGLSVVITQPNNVVNQYTWVWNTLS
jgi:phage gp46-like protein